MIPYFQPPSLSLGPFTLEIFGLFAAAGIALGASLSGRQARREGLDTNLLMDFALWGVLSGVVFGHLVHLFAYHPEELRDPWKILRVWDGLSSFGGLLGGLLAAVVYFRRRGASLLRYGDAFALGIAPGWAVARLGCFAVHDHPGVRSDFVLAVAFPGGARHDLGLYDALLLAGCAVVLHALNRRGLLMGRLLALLALLYGLGRFFLDFLRASDLAYSDARYLGLTPAQYACILLVGWGAWFLWQAARRPRIPSDTTAPVAPPQ